MLTTIERAITERIITSALKAGYLVGASADDSADIDPTDNLADILESAFSYDCVDLSLAPTNRKLPSGWIALNFFNDGLDIISDYSTDLEGFISGLTFKQLSIDL